MILMSSLKRILLALSAPSFVLGIGYLSSVSSAYCVGTNLVTCTIVSSNETSTVSVPKWLPGLPPEQHHLSAIFSKNGTSYYIAETFDRTGRVGIAPGSPANNGGMAGFGEWIFQVPPVEYVDTINSVSITCE